MHLIKTIFFDAAGSFIKPGAALIVDDVDAYALQFDSTGAYLTVPRKDKGDGGSVIKRLIKKGSTVKLVVKNPDGKVSVAVMFTRTE